MTNNIRSSGNITLSNSMTKAGAGILIADTACTLTSNGKIWNGDFSLLMH
jgi:hypothetical protein